MAATTDIIYPPLDIKSIVDKTAEHVAKSGQAFEQLIREKYQGNAKFSFIYPNDPYFAYYEHKVIQYSRQSTSSDVQSTDATAAATAVDTLDQQINDQPISQPESEAIKATKPEPLQFVVTMPAVSALDLDVLRLTAQYVARNGSKFMTGLVHRESENYQFDFMSPHHSLFPYFQSLVDQYGLVLAPPEETLKQRVDKDSKNKFQIMERVQNRLQWAMQEAQEKALKDEELEAEKQAYQSIDWHDFVVVGTVEFVEEDVYADLPVPAKLQDLKNMSLEDKHKSVAAENATPVKEAKEKEEEEEEEEEEEDDIEMEVEEEEEEMEDVTVSSAALGPMKIRKGYKPNLRRGPEVAAVTLQCQLCKQDIPASEFDEHIRVELIDPKWKEQKRIYERRIQESNLAQGVDMAEYLKQLASRRAGGGDDPAAKQPDNRVIWDGYSSSASRATKRAKKNATASGQEKIPAVPQQVGPQQPSTTRQKRRK